MSQVFLEDGTVIPITWASVEKSEGVAEGDVVAVTGTSKGKGFSGVIKRHNFNRQPKTHGQSDRERTTGSIGSETHVSRVLKGKRMPGKHGRKTVTIKDIKIIRIEDTKIALSGPLPGAFGSEIKIKKTSEEQKN